MSNEKKPQSKEAKELIQAAETRKANESNEDLPKDVVAQVGGKFAVRNRIKEQQDEYLQQIHQLEQRMKAEREAFDMGSDKDGFPSIGVWRNPTEREKLGLNTLKPGTELILDTVPVFKSPYVGDLKTNGVTFPQGSQQLLPASMWADIKGRASKRETEERNFQYPKLYIESVGEHNGNLPRG